MSAIRFYRSWRRTRSPRRGQNAEARRASSTRGNRPPVFAAGAGGKARWSRSDASKPPASKEPLWAILPARRWARADAYAAFEGKDARRLSGFRGANLLGRFPDGRGSDVAIVRGENFLVSPKGPPQNGRIAPRRGIPPPVFGGARDRPVETRKRKFFRCTRTPRDGIATPQILGLEQVPHRAPEESPTERGVTPGPFCRRNWRPSALGTTRPCRSNPASSSGRRRVGDALAGNIYAGPDARFEIQPPTAVHSLSAGHATARRALCHGEAFP